MNELKDWRLAEAFHQGRYAGQRQQSVEMNPFRDGTEEFKQWLAGRMSALGESMAKYADKAVLATCLLAPVFVKLMGG
jgi:ribosome modulation factor